MGGLPRNGRERKLEQVRKLTEFVTLGAEGDPEVEVARKRLTDLIAKYEIADYEIYPGWTFPKSRKQARQPQAAKTSRKPKTRNRVTKADKERILAAIPELLRGVGVFSSGDIQKLVQKKLKVKVSNTSFSSTYLKPHVDAGTIIMEGTRSKARYYHPESKEAAREKKKRELFDEMRKMPVLAYQLNRDGRLVGVEISTFEGGKVIGTLVDAEGRVVTDWGRAQLLIKTGFAKKFTL